VFPGRLSQRKDYTISVVLNNSILSGKERGRTVMDQEFIAQMKTSLTDLKKEIISNLMAGNKDFKEIMEGMDPKDLADIASDDIDRKMIEALGSQDLKRLRLIDSALTRIQQGKYGLCMKCGKRIPRERLEAIPYALMCIDCKTADERRNR
jgi:RNA polymerase-binding protein DksA